MRSTKLKMEVKCQTDRDKLVKSHEASCVGREIASEL